MSAKNVRKPSRSIRYLLSGDRKLQKLSLRRMSALAKNGQKPGRRRPSGPAQRAMDFLHFPWTIQTRAIALATIFVVGVVTLIAARQSAPDAGSPSSDAASGNRPATLASFASASGPTARTSAATPTTPGADPDAKARTDASTPITITGCLALDNDTFLLKDASGTEAPKSRSWKTGFLKKRTSPIALVDTAHTLKLSTQVGRRVAATGVLANGEMRVRVVQRVAASCG
jgi:hypothetical protein